MIKLYETNIFVQHFFGLEDYDACWNSNYLNWVSSALNEDFAS